MLTADQLAALHDELGEHDDADLEARYVRLGTVEAVAMSVVRTRLAALQAAPASFTIPGVISTSQGDNIRAAQAQLQRIADRGLVGDPSSAGGSDELVRVRSKPRVRR